MTLNAASTQNLCWPCQQMVGETRLCKIERADGQPWEVPQPYKAWNDDVYLLINASTVRLPASSDALGLSESLNDILEAAVPHLNRSKLPLRLAGECAAAAFQYPKLLPCETESSLCDPCQLCGQACLDVRTAIRVESDVVAVLLTAISPAAEAQANEELVAIERLNIRFIRRDQHGKSQLRKSMIFIDQNITEYADAALQQPVGDLSQKSVETMRKWLAECCKSSDHRLCNENIYSVIPRNTFLPTRLLNIQKDLVSYSVRLVEVSELREQATAAVYATLSHCWGKGDAVSKLLLANYTDWLNAIPLVRLPLTFQHAVRVATELGIEYLWIDSMCIIQDSRRDWAMEATRMADVYSHGLVNLAATASADSRDGLFVQRNVLAGNPLRLSWSALPPSCRVWRLGSRERSRTEWIIKRSPLNKRAWVFQEYLLSPRTIHFAADQIWWDCQASSWDEAGLEGRGSNKYNNPSKSIGQVRWPLLVEQYLLMNLTFPSDRLIAFSGIAAACANRSKWPPDHYIAGLWWRDIESELLWYMESYAVAAATDDRDGTNATYLAPSWSWLSIVRPLGQWHPGFTKSWLNLHPAFQVTDVSLSLANESSFAPLEDASLELKCFVHPCCLKIKQQVLTIAGSIYKVASGPEQARSEVRTASTETDGAVFRCLVYLDRYLKPGQEHELPGFFVPVVNEQVVPPNSAGPLMDEFKGLLIASTDSSCTAFRRLGLIKVFGIFKRAADTTSWWLRGSTLPLGEAVGEQGNGERRIRLF